MVYHSRFITGEQATWIGKLSVAASIHWFEHLAFGEMASVLVFIGAATAILATGGGRRAVALNSTIGTCAFGGKFPAQHLTQPEARIDTRRRRDARGPPCCKY
jgi:hypothetical protein